MTKTPMNKSGLISSTKLSVSVKDIESEVIFHVLNLTNPDKSCEFLDSLQNSYNTFKSQHFIPSDSTDLVVDASDSFSCVISFLSSIFHKYDLVNDALEDIYYKTCWLSKSLALH